MGRLSKVGFLATSTDLFQTVGDPE